MLFEKNLNMLIQGYLTAACLAMYYALSGFLFYQNLTQDNLLRKMKSRVRSLLIPYLFWNAMVFIFFIMIGNADLKEAFEYIVLAKNSPTYFIGIILVYVALSPIIDKCLKNKLTCVILFIVAIILAIVLISIGHFGFMNFLNTSHYNLIFYLLGAWAGKYEALFIKTRLPGVIRYTAIPIIIILAYLFFKFPELRII